MELLIAALINGIIIGGVYGLASSAFSYQAGALSFANFAYGSSIMLSMYFTYYSINVWKLPIPVAILVVFGMALILGIFMRKTLLKKTSHGTQILTTMGLDMVLISLANFFFTSYPRSMGIFEKRIFFTRNISIGLIQLSCFVLSAIFLFGFQFVLTKTWTGRAIRSVVQDKEVAQLMGINSEATLDIAFCFSYILVGISGIMLMLMFQVEPAYGGSVALIAFIVVIVGGLGDMKAAFVTGILYGITSALVTTFLGAKFHDPLIYVLFVVVLLIRPNGIFTKKEKISRAF